jgi:serine/threonine-protein kinase
MTPDQHAHAKKIFLEVCSAQLSEQEELLDQLCGDDLVLKAEVARLLAYHIEDTITDENRPTMPATDHAVAESTTYQSGQLIADRYRIVTQIGRGAMGEVYRAEDLKLNQTVALKFLRTPAIGGGTWLARLHQEVRLAREVTHPHVCRVFDIGEAAGDHFISMEFVDGENLAVLLQRIGRLPQDKGIDIARQICSGLAAAHAKGVLHRDLKTANIMLDGRGQIRVTDFGLAAPAGEVTGLEIRSGTPAYMAPEQISGREVTVQSDLYAVGLILYEVLTGRPAFQAESMAEFAELHESAHPTPMSEILEEVSPDVEGVVARCLAKQPQDRPISALAIAAALPGVDLLVAALAGNETPSPEMIAAASPVRTRTPGPIGLLMVVLALLVGLVGARTQLHRPWEAPGSLSPELLAAQAREAIQLAGYSLDSKHSAYGFCDVDEASRLTEAFRVHADTAKPTLLDRSAGFLFWYRVSPTLLVPGKVGNALFGVSRVEPTDPPLATPGMMTVVSDLTGKLLFFAAIPELRRENRDAAAAPRPAGTWDRLFEHAGLDPAKLTPSEPTFESMFGSDERSTWAGVVEDPDHLSVRVEGAMSGSLPVYFMLAESEDVATPSGLSSNAWRVALAIGATRFVLIILTLAALPWAWRNYRSGRGDRDGALRLAAFVFVLRLITWLLQSTHVPEFGAEVTRLCIGVMRSLGEAAVLWLFYIALEPTARRQWPHMLISWARAMVLRFRDPVVGRHALIGVCVGIYWALLVVIDRWSIEWLGHAPRPVLMGNDPLGQMLGGRFALAAIFDRLYGAIHQGLLFLMLLAALRAATRRSILSAALAVAILAPMFTPYGAHQTTAWLTLGLGGVAVGVWLMIRFGLVALTVALLTASMLNRFPITLDLRLWYADLTLLVVAIVLGLALYGFAMARISVDNSETG